MKKRLIIAACGLSFLGAGCGQSEQTGHAAAPSADFAAYIAVHKALAGDDLDGALEALQDLRVHSSGSMKELASQTASFPEIEAVRKGFTAISDEMAKQKIPQGYGLVFCPMANDDQGAHWIQKEGTVMNPYFGRSMLHCGVFKDAAEEKP